MNSRGAAVLFIVFLAIALYVRMGYRASSALERAVCAQGTDHACGVLRKTDARIALRVAWWMWPWNVGKSDAELREAFVAHFVK